MGNIQCISVKDKTLLGDHIVDLENAQAALIKIIEGINDQVKKCP